MEAVLYSLVAGATSIVGILLVIRWQDWTIRHSHFVNSLAAGVILGVAFFGLIPQAHEQNDHALVFVFVGFLVFYLIETMAVFHSGTEIHFHEDDTHVHSARGSTVFAGLFLHSLIDGVVIGLGFKTDHHLGVLAAVGVILHELPEGATTFALLITRIKKRAATLLAVLVGVATPLGALLCLTFLHRSSPAVLGAMLALAAGSFVYVGASDLIPETHTRKGWLNAVCFVAGALLAYLLGHAGHGH